MTATAGGKLKQRYGSSPAAIFTFVASLVRTNLECELVQRGGTLQTCVAPRYKPRNECIGMLYYKLKQRYSSSPAAVFTFVALLVRANLECELVQCDGMLQTCVAPRYKPRNKCIGMLHYKQKQRYGSSPAAIFTFVASLVHTNFECELVQRDGTLRTCGYKPRNKCIGMIHYKLK